MFFSSILLSTHLSAKTGPDEILEDKALICHSYVFIFYTIFCFVGFFFP